MTRNHRSASIVDLANLARDPSSRDAVIQELAYRGRTPKAHALAALLGCTVLDRASGFQRAPFKHLTGDAKKAAEASFVAPPGPDEPVTLDVKQSMIRKLQAQLAAMQVPNGAVALPPLPPKVVVDSGVVDGIDYGQERTADGLKTHDKRGKRRSPKAIANTRKMLLAKAAKAEAREAGVVRDAFPQDSDYTAPADPGVNYESTQEIKASDIPLNSDAALVAWITENQ